VVREREKEEDEARPIAIYGLLFHVPFIVAPPTNLACCAAESRVSLDVIEELKECYVIFAVRRASRPRCLEQ
jgi:hypothetical protein